MRRAVLALVLTLAGCGTADQRTGPPPAPSAARAGATPPATTTALPPTDMQGHEACTSAWVALDTSGPVGPNAMKAVAALAALSPSQPLRAHGVLLGRSADRAAASRGGSDESTMSAALSAEVATFVGVCADNGYAGQPDHPR